MLSYIIRRVLLFFPTLLGMTGVVFAVMYFSPGGIAGPLLNQIGNMKPKEAQALRAFYNRKLGLDKPGIVQYGLWLNRISPLGWGEDPANPGVYRSFGFKVPDLGDSAAKGRPVIELMEEALPVTLLLNALTIPTIYFVSILVGIYSASKRGQAFDVISGSTLMALYSAPTMWVGVLLIGYLANRQYVQWFPTGGLHDTLASSMTFLPTIDATGFHRGWVLDTLWHLALPVVCLTYGGFAFLSKLTRSAVLDNLAADYARTARAKGLPARVVLFRHVFRNSLLPLITIAANILPALIGGSVVIESIFSIPGMGQLAVFAAEARDRDLVLAEALVAGALSLVAYLLADLGYALADPRVSYE